MLLHVSIQWRHIFVELASNAISRVTDADGYSASQEPTIYCSFVGAMSMSTQMLRPIVGFRWIDWCITIISDEVTQGYVHVQPQLRR